jgi:MFS family permease
MLSPAAIQSEGARRPGDLRRSIRLAIADSIVAQPIVVIAIPVNVYLAALFTKGFGLTTAAIGFISALPLACQVLQLPISPFVARWGSAKSVTLVSTGLQLLAWLALALVLPVIPPRDSEPAAWWIGGFVFASSLCGSIAGVAWSGWMQEWVPPRLLGKFFARRKRLSDSAGLLFLLGAGWMLARYDYRVGVFQLIVAAAGLLRLLSIILLWLSPAPAPAARIERALPLAQQWRIVRGSRPLGRMIVFGAAWGFGANCVAPFYNVFMLEQLAFSAFDLSVFAALGVIGGVFSLPTWGRLLDRYGHKPVMLVSLLLWKIPFLLWCVITPSKRNLAYALWTWSGLMGAGFALGQFTMMLKLVPSAAKNFGLATSIALTSIAAAAAPAVGGLVLAAALRHSSADPIFIYHLCFIAPPAVAFVSGLLLLRVPEPGAHDLRDLFRRPWRISSPAKAFRST